VNGETQRDPDAKVKEKVSAAEVRRLVVQIKHLFFGETIIWFN
jgi:hypothetical protein